MKKRVTVKDIAQICGVSIGSVDRAIHNRPGINNETREKILKACEEYGFRINRFAQSLSRQQYNLAAVLPKQNVDFYKSLEKGLRRAAEELSDLNVSLQIIKNTRNGYQAEKEILEKIGEMNLNGIALCVDYAPKLNEAINAIINKDIPVVTMATDAPESIRTTTVAVSPEKTGEIAASYMTRFIHEAGTVCVLRGNNEAMGQTRTAETFFNSIRKNRPELSIGEIFNTDEKPAKLKRAVDEIKAKYDDLKGIYLTAWGGHICAARLEELGLQEEIVFFATGIYTDLWPYLDNGTIDLLVHRNPHRQGALAINLLFDMLTGKGVDKDKHHVRPEFIIRESLWFYR